MCKRPLSFAAAALVAGALLVPSVTSAQEAPAEGSAPLTTKLPADAIVGEWCTPKEEGRPPGRIKFIHANDGTYQGIITWSAEPKNDVHNKDPKLRDRSLVGTVIMWHLRYDDGEYVDGYVYNPEDGGTYGLKAEMLSPESLKVRGFLGISLFGQDRTWTRYHP